MCALKLCTIYQIKTAKTNILAIPHRNKKWHNLIMCINTYKQKWTKANKATICNCFRSVNNNTIYTFINSNNNVLTSTTQPKQMFAHTNASRVISALTRLAEIKITFSAMLIQIWLAQHCTMHDTIQWAKQHTTHMS